MNFSKIIEKVLEHEGGYVNDPNDLGGETNYGITKRFYPDVDIKNLTRNQAKDIYKRDYWDKNRVESLPENLWHIFFDMCVNMGRGTAVKILQRAANGKGRGSHFILLLQGRDYLTDREIVLAASGLA